MRFPLPPGAPAWAHDLARALEAALAEREARRRPLRLLVTAKADLPAPAAHAHALIYVSDETGGAIPAFSDGSDWRRVTDRAVVS